MKGVFYGILAGLVIGVTLWVFFLRPPKTPFNPVLQNKVDSFTVVDRAKDSALIALQARLNPKIDSLNKLTDSLGDDVVTLRDELEGKNDLALFYARQVQYYRAKKDTAEYNAGCDVLAKQVIMDSAIIQSYIHNNERLIYTFGELVKDKDSVIMTQKNLILSDSVLISAQKDLNEKQSKDINKLVRKGKVTAWIGRSFLVVITGLVIALSIK